MIIFASNEVSKFYLNAYYPEMDKDHVNLFCGGFGAAVGLSGAVPIELMKTRAQTAD